MLRALEALLADPVRGALPAEVDTVLGPCAPEGAGAVVVHARALRIDDAAEPVSLSTQPRRVVLHEWEADGRTLEFELPDVLRGEELAELESPPGHTLAPGDAYYLEGGTLRFYRAPTATVRARLRGAPASGWAERRRCTVELEVAAWAPDMADADRRLGAALAAVLAAVVELPVLEGSEGAELGVSLRVLGAGSSFASRRSPVAPSVLRGLLRRRDPEHGMLAAVAQLELRGELDLVVARGEAEPLTLIRALAGRVEVQGGGQLRPAQEFAIHAEHRSTSASAIPASAEPGPGPSPASAARPIESVDLGLLRNLGKKTRMALAALPDPPTTLRELAELDVDAVVDNLGDLDPGDARALVRRAQLALEFRVPAQVGAGADEVSISSLLAMSADELGAAFGLDGPTAADLRRRLPTLTILFPDSALDQLHASDWTPS